MKTFRKPLLLGLLTFLSIMLIQAWMVEDVRKKNIPTDTIETPLPTMSPTVSRQTDKAEDITIRSDVLQVRINKVGGGIYQAQLTKYANSITDSAPFTLFSQEEGHVYGAESGVSGDEALVFKPEPTKSKADASTVVLTAKNKDGVVFKKTYTLKQGQYDITVTNEVINQGKKTWSGQHYARFRGYQDTDITQKPVPKPKDYTLDNDEPKAGFMSFNTYQGPAYYSDDKPYVKTPFTEFATKPTNTNVKQDGWICIQQRYFISAWITGAGPREIKSSWQNGTLVDSNTTYRQLFQFDSLGESVSLAPGQSSTHAAKLYAGPEIASVLAGLANGLEFTVDYGWLWFISDILFKTLVFIHTYLGSWGWAIVMTTLLVKILFYKMSESNYRTMALQKKLAPRIQALQDRYPDDPEKRSQATLELYRKENIDPLRGGCLPTLVQIPFFAALYYVLIESVQLRHASFYWVPDLSSHDPYFILPIAVGAAMALTNHMTPKAPDPAQAQAMMFMPILFTAMFAFAPAGLVLYWFTNNLLSALQQWYISKKYAKEGL